MRQHASQCLFVVPQILLADLQRILQKHRIQPLALASGTHADSLRTRTRSELQRLGDRIRFVCILGDWELVPPFEIDHPIDGESSFSDAPYGGASTDVSDPMSCIPKMGVARIPSRDINVIERVLFEPLVNQTATASFAFSVTAKRWQNASTAILSGSVMQDRIVEASGDSQDAFVSGKSPNLLLSPDWDVSDLTRWIENNPLPQGSLIHFNVHGGADTPDWVGEGDWGDYQAIFSPGTIQNFSKAVLLTEACFGGAMGYDDPSVVEHFFAHGGHAFVGCSVPAYGDPGEEIYGVPTFGADTLALAFFNRLQQGMKLGEALCAAKMAVLSDDPPLCHPYSVKTMASFNLYGAPWHALKKEHSPGQSASVALASGGASSALDRIRSRMAQSGSGSEAEDDGSLLNGLRASYGARIRVPLSQQTFSHQEASARLQSLLANPQIGSLLNRRRMNTHDLRLHEVRHSDQSGFLIEGRSHPHQQLVLVVNDQGQLMQVIATKSGDRK